MVWKETRWTMSMLMQRREMTKEERVAWRLHKQKIVKGGTTLLRWLFVIDIALFALWPEKWRESGALTSTTPTTSTIRMDTVKRMMQECSTSTMMIIEAHTATTSIYAKERMFSQTLVIQMTMEAATAKKVAVAAERSQQWEELARTQRHALKAARASPPVVEALPNRTRKHRLPKQYPLCKSHKEPEQQPRSKRLTGTCKDRNVLRRPIPRDARARYFIEHIYKPTDADSSFRQTPCSTSSCRWLQSLLDSGGSARKEAARGNPPCTDFYRHVCEAKTRSPYKTGSDKLMDSMRRIISRHKTQEGALPANSDSLFKRCMEGVDLMIKDHIRYDWDEKKLDGCSYNVPKTPLTLSERFFKSGRRRTMPEFFDYIRSLTNNLSLDDSTLPATGFFTREWIPAACQWVARSARCHYAIDLAMETGEHLDRYQLYWKVIYFSPLLGPMANRIFEAVFDEPPKARVQACFNLMEDHYITNTTKTARLALKNAIRRPHDILSKVSWLLRWALRDRVPRWLSRRNRQDWDVFVG
ncbi:uncharacterized protein LOC119401790 [Rhipicephalus sanguineus]|uniref:uncharacterized protein LOC119401790 n=1 Tax=Rhipicephalus sanguineus TaxID=34632 RepID=UPI0020C2477E|nr:uncharacterized protein LOC119401790 [Rhipicephalus sanguineus]